MISAESDYKALLSSKYNLGDLSPVQASDEMITIFCRLHGGLEIAMPIVRNQFKKNGVDFTSPTKDGLVKLAVGLVKVTDFLKGPELADQVERRFKNLLARVKDNGGPILEH